MRNLIWSEVEQVDLAVIMCSKQEVGLSVTQHFVYQWFLLWIKTDSISKWLFNMVKERKRRIIVTNNKLILLGFQPGRTGWYFFIVGLRAWISKPSSNSSRVVRQFGINLSAVPYQYWAVCTYWKKQILEGVVLEVPEGFSAAFVRPSSHTVVLAVFSISILINIRDCWHIPNSNATFVSCREQHIWVLWSLSCFTESCDWE